MRFVCLLQKFDHSVFIAGNGFLLWAPQFFSHHHRSVVGHLARRPRSVCGLWQRQSLHICLSQNHCLWYVDVNVSHWFSTHVCKLSAEEGMCVFFLFCYIQALGWCWLGALRSCFPRSLCCCTMVSWPVRRQAAGPANWLWARTPFSGRRLALPPIQRSSESSSLRLSSLKGQTNKTVGKIHSIWSFMKEYTHLFYTKKDKHFYVVFPSC